MARRKEEDAISLDKAQRHQAVLALQEWFHTEREEEIGGLQADMLVDMILKKIAPMIYNAAIADMQRFMQEKIEESFILLKE